MSDASENSATQKWIDDLSRMPRDHLGYREWFYITGIGLGDFGLYNISNSGVGFNKFSNQSLQYTSYEEREILMGIDYQTPLTFPCTLQELFDFVDGPAGQFGGVHFTLPDGFRDAAAETLAQSSMDQAERDIQDTPTSGDSSMTGSSPKGGSGGTASANRTEARIAAIVKTARQFGYDPLSVPYGGKAAIERECIDKLAADPCRFTPDTFKSAWQAARDAQQIDVQNAEIYRGQ